MKRYSDKQERGLEKATRALVRACYAMHNADEIHAGVYDDVMRCANNAKRVLSAMTTENKRLGAGE